MTAEIAILNKEAVALAADSAVTATFRTNQKIFGSANKLFALSKFSPVGVMVYGNAQYMDIPWETIIKQYRRSLDNTIFKTLFEYADNFISYLDRGNDYVPAPIQDKYFFGSVTAFFQYIKSKINNEIEKFLVEKQSIEGKEISKIVKETIKFIFDQYKQADFIPSLPKDFIKKLKQKYREDVKKSRDKVFEKLPISSVESRRLNEIAYFLFSKTLPNLRRSNTSGIVIAGFGDKDIFPSLRVYNIDGFVNNRLIYSQLHEFKIGFNKAAAVVPFAQQEMVATFMEGINPAYERLINKEISELFKIYTDKIVDNMKSIKTKNAKEALKTKLISINKKMLEKLNNEFDEHRKNEFSNPIVAVVSSLPKDELASMAESLINLTSLKRRVSLDQETVGGPIDVAVISKSDGFVWIRRKRYFERNINPRFFANYNKN